MKNRYAKIPKKYRITKKNPTVWRILGEPSPYFWIWRFHFPRWIFRPICRFKGHKNQVSWPYGTKIKTCERCAKVFYKKQTKEKPTNLYQGEVGELYSVRFIKTKRRFK